MFGLATQMAQEESKNEKTEEVVWVCARCKSLLTPDPDPDSSVFMHELDNKCPNFLRSMRGERIYAVSMALTMTRPAYDVLMKERVKPPVEAKKEPGGSVIPWPVLLSTLGL